MNEATQSIDPVDVEDRIIDLSSATLSQRDYAVYIGEMSAQLSRMANIGALPDEIGYCLEFAARAAQDWAEEIDAALRASEREIDG